jgi:hypothetical protein
MSAVGGVGERPSAGEWERRDERAVALGQEVNALVWTRTGVELG